VGFDVIDVACSYYPTFNGTLSAPWFFGKPVPSDRLPCWWLTPRAPWRFYSAPGVMPPVKINGESNVVMRHGECPRYADEPCAWLDWQCTPALRSFRRSLGYPSLLPTDSRRLEWQFSDPLSTHQNKVRHVAKGSQGMGLAWGTSPKFEGLSDWLLLAHLW